MEWHDPECRRMDPVPFDNELWTCQACGTIGPLQFFTNLIDKSAISPINDHQEPVPESIQPLSWPECVEYSEKPFSEDIAKALRLVEANHPQVYTGINYRAGEVSDAYGRETLPVTYPELTDHSHIRLLELLPAPREKVLEGRFLVVDVEQAPAYEALSYTWADANGDASLCQRIFIGRHGNRALPITLNCYQALRHLRHEREPLLIWVDSICIDQSDLSERSYQVAMMGTIFHKAKVVHGYVGEATDGSEGGEVGAMTLLKNEFGSSEQPSRQWKDYAKDVLGSFFKRPFFSRLWVVQEVLLAQSILLHCGHLSTPISGDMVIKAKAQNAEVPWWMTQIGWIRSQNKGDMAQLLSATALCKTGDMRDKIFGLLGLVGGEEVDVLKADYNLTVREVYIGTAAYFIQNKGRHNTIELTESMTNLKLRTRYGIPSWVPMWDLQETAYTPADISKRLGEIERGWEVFWNRNPSLSSQPGSHLSKSSFRPIPFWTDYDTTKDPSTMLHYNAVDATTGCLITSGYEIAVLYYTNFDSIEESSTPDGLFRESHYKMLNKRAALAISGPMSTFRSCPERMLGLSDMLALVKISGSRMPFVANKHVRDGDAVTYELLYPCVSAIVCSMSKEQLYSKHPDFYRTCILEASHPLTLDIIKSLYHWRRIMRLRSDTAELSESEASSLRGEEVRATNLFIGYSVITGEHENSLFVAGEKERWKLKLESDPDWKSNRRSPMVNDLLSELAELEDFWDPKAFDDAEKLIHELDIASITQKIDHWRVTLGRFSSPCGARSWTYNEEVQRQLKEAWLSTWKKAFEFLFRTFSHIFPTDIQRETLFPADVKRAVSLLPATVDEISDLAESWIGAYKNEQEAIWILDSRWGKCTHMLSVLTKSAERIGEAKQVLMARREMSRMFGVGREFEKIIIE